MKHTQVPAIALAVSALITGQALAADTDTTLTRAYVQAELAEALRTGNFVVGESSERLNEQAPQNYPPQETGSSVTRDRVQAELDNAISAGKVQVGENSTW